MINIKLIVTGGLGFIGSNFINYWLKRYPNDSILNIDKVTYAADLSSIDREKVKNNYSFIKEDICSEYTMKKLARDCDIIVNFAAESHVDNSIKDASQFIHSNYLGVYSLLEAARKHDIRFHQVSTDEVFGSVPLNSDVSFTEKSKYNPRNPYSATKAAADHLVRSYANTYELKATISNCGNNFGPNQHSEKLIPKTIINALKGKRIPIYGTGSNKRDWVYVLDHCSALESVLNKGRIGETYLIGSRNNMSNIEVVQFILDKLNIDENLIEFVPDRPGHDTKYSIDPSKIEQELGWRPEFSFENSVSVTIDFYRRRLLTI